MAADASNFTGHISPELLKTTYNGIPIATHALVIHSPTDDIGKNFDLIQDFCQDLFKDGIAFIPYSMKYSHEEFYSKMIAQHDAWDSKHRNIGIGGISVKAMINGGDKALYKNILELPGVNFCHPCRRTFAIGKWNISTDIEHFPETKDWLAKNLPVFFKITPEAIRGDFPNPFKEFSIVGKPAGGGSAGPAP